MVLDDAWVVVTRNEREWLTAQGYGDATHDLSHPAIGSQFVIVGMDSMGWLQVLSVQAWLHTRMDLAIWIHPGVVRAFRPNRVVYTLAKDTEAPNGCQVTDLRHLLKNPDADAEAKRHYGSCLTCTHRIWRQDAKLCSEIFRALLWVVMDPDQGRDHAIRCLGGKHRSNMFGWAVVCITGIHWWTHEKKFKNRCSVETACSSTSAAEFLRLAGLHQLGSLREAIVTMWAANAEHNVQCGRSGFR